MMDSPERATDGAHITIDTARQIQYRFGARVPDIPPETSSADDVPSVLVCNSGSIQSLTC
jgi:hypothetical protein